MKNLILVTFMLISINAFTQQYTYYKAQLHCHSTNSDGAISPQTVAKEYKARGYEIVCLTDHNYMTPDSTYAIPGLLTISSEEITFDRHMNGWFLNHTVNATTPQAAIDSVKAQGGLIQFNHPVNSPSSSFPFPINEDYRYSYQQFNALNNGLNMIEVHNASTDMVGAKFKMSIWDSLLMQNRKIWGTATDDMHKLKMYGIKTIDVGWIMVLLNTLCRDSVKAAMERGDFYGSNGITISNYTVNGNTISVSSPNAKKIIFIGDYGKKLAEVSDSTASFTRTTQKYVRIVLMDKGFLGIRKKFAFTQPKFFNDKPMIADKTNTASDNDESANKQGNN